MSAAPPRFALARSARLRFDRIEGRHVLLSPDRGLTLSDTAAAIVRRCDGAHDEAAIVEACVREYGEGARGSIAGDVPRVLQTLLARGLVVAVAP